MRAYTKRKNPEDSPLHWAAGPVSPDAAARPHHLERWLPLLSLSHVVTFGYIETHFLHTYFLGILLFLPPMTTGVVTCSPTFWMLIPFFPFSLGLLVTSEVFVLFLSSWLVLELTQPNTGIDACISARTQMSSLFRWTFVVLCTNEMYFCHIRKYSSFLPVCVSNTRRVIGL